LSLHKETTQREEEGHEGGRKGGREQGSTCAVFPRRVTGMPTTPHMMSIPAALRALAARR